MDISFLKKIHRTLSFVAVVTMFARFVLDYVVIPVFDELHKDKK